MLLSKQERILFATILISLVGSGCLLLVVGFSVPQRIVKRAWVGSVSELITEDLIGAPSRIIREVQAVLFDDTQIPHDSFNTGFVIKGDGFGFRNYGTRFPEGNLTINEVREIFGDQVCLSIKGETCLATPAAQVWIDAMVDYMAEGHCAGFTITGSRFFGDQLDQDLFDPTAVMTYDVRQNTLMMRQIAKDWTLQVTEEVQSDRVGDTPRNIIEELLARREAVDLGIFNRTGGGHSLLAYGIEEKGEGLFHILVYDNNWPGQDLYVEVDYLANTWRYSLGAQNPTEDTKAWEGDALTKSLIFFPFPAYDKDVKCPFCKVKDPTADENLTFIALSGSEGLLQVTDNVDQRLGHFGDDFVKEIPGSRLVRLKDNMYNDREPYLGIPIDTDFDIKIGVRPERDVARANLRIGGPKVVMAIKGIRIEARQEDSVSVIQSNGEIIYSPGSNSGSPVIMIAGENDQGKTIIATISVAEMEPGQNLSVALDPQSGELTLAGTGFPPDSTLNVVIAVIDQNGAGDIFASSAVPVAPKGSTVTLDVGGWNGEETMTVTVDPTGDGSATSTIDLPDQPVGEVLVNLGSGDEIISMVSDLSPYMNEEETESFLEAVVELAQEGVLDGDQTGEILYEMAALELSNKQIVVVIQAGDFPIDEVADLISELNLPPEAQNALIENLGLSPEELEQLQEALAELEEVNSILIEVEFENFETVAKLGEFLNQHGLEPEQIGELFEELSLSPGELVETLTQIELSPNELGQVLGEVGLPPEELAEVLTELALSPEEVGQILAQIELPPEALAEVLAEMGLTLEQVATITAIIEETTTEESSSTSTESETTTETSTEATTEATTEPTTEATTEPTTEATTEPTVEPTVEPTTEPPPSGGGSSGGSGNPPANGGPTGVNDGATTNEDTFVDINVVANDTDPEGDALSPIAVTTPANGTAIIVGNLIRYTPNANFAGTDTFNYTVSDGNGGTATATVTVTVTNVNDPPTMISTAILTATQNVAYSYIISSADVDLPYGEVLTITAPTQPGWLTLTPSGNGGATLAGTPGGGDVGVHNVVLQVQDAGALTATQTFSLTVSAAPFNITVDRTDDTNAPAAQVCSAAANDCSLRGAISKANADAGNAYTITVPAGVYTLTIASTDEDTNLNGDLDITDDIIINGAGAGTTIIDGGGIDRVFHISGAFSANLNDMTIQNGSEATNFGGGGINNTGGTVSVSNVAIINNSAPGSRGGGVTNNTGIMTVVNSTISGNSAKWSAGLDNIFNGTMTVINSTISGNTGGCCGGGFSNEAGAGNILNIINSTISDNSASSGGGIRNVQGSLNISNTIVANSPSGGDCANSSTVNDNGYNLIEDGTCISAGTSLSGDPNLAALANNGGNTDTHALLAGSPAIDAIPNGANGCGTTITTDQRGVTRPGGSACEIGAYELGLTDGLVAYYPFDSNFSDERGNNPSGVAQGSANISNSDFFIGGGAAELGSANGGSNTDHVTIAAPHDLNFGSGPFTVLGWVRFNGHGTGRQVYGSRNGTGTDGWHIRVESNGNWSLEYDTDTQANQTSSQHHLHFAWNGGNNFTNWHLAGLVVDPVGGTVTGYGGTNTGGTLQVRSGTALTFGGSVDNAGPFYIGTSFDATYDEFAFWNRALTQTEVSQFFNNGAGVNLSTLSISSLGIPVLPVQNPSETTIHLPLILKDDNRHYLK